MYWRGIVGALKAYPPPLSLTPPLILLPALASLLSVVLFRCFAIFCSFLGQARFYLCLGAELGVDIILRNELDT